MWGADAIRSQAAVVAGVADDVSRVAVDIARIGDVDFRSRAADALRRRLGDLVVDVVAARRACDEAAGALGDHAAVLRDVADVASGVGDR